MIIHRYDRLSSLSHTDHALDSYRHIQKGDCVVGFGRNHLYTIKNLIESKSKDNLKCCVIYGGLPPEARKIQAQLFDDEKSGYDVLVASDAIGK